MKDNRKVFDNLYEYDFEACVYNLLNNIQCDLSHIDYDNKELRNIQIGQMQKENPVLKHVLSDGMKRLIRLYVKENNLKEENLVWRQKDGFIVDKVLESTDISFKLLFRKNITKLIKSMDNKKLLILYMDNTVAIKGMIHKPLDTSFYKLMFNIDFSNRKKILEGCEYLRKTFLASNNMNWFARESKDGVITIPMKGDTLLKISKSMLSNIDSSDVDKFVIYSNYIYPFVQTLLIQYNERERRY